MTKEKMSHPRILEMLNRLEPERGIKLIVPFLSRGLTINSSAEESSFFLEKSYLRAKNYLVTKDSGIISVFPIKD
jgi:hypothetical protein